MTPPHSYPTLTSLLGPQLAEMERVCALGQSGKYAGQSIYDRTADHHFGRAQSHALAGTVDLGELDADTGAPHLLLAALRLMMATACVEREGDHGIHRVSLDGAPAGVVPAHVHERGWQWRPTTTDTAFAPPFGTIRQCRGCGCLVAGGPSACVRCAKAENK